MLLDVNKLIFRDHTFIMSAHFVLFLKHPFTIYFSISIVLNVSKNCYFLIEMSSSWNFPAGASPSCEVSEPSWGTLISELKSS